ncbi:MAG: uridine kinase [Gammaproteobacteria bacterium]|nr:uridine kinase [Gammaproteobacteria bacterium]
MFTYDEIAANLHQRATAMPPGKQWWIGLAGGPGSGKSTLTEALKARLGGLLAVIPLDGYHYTRRQLDAMEDPKKAHERRGAPFTFDAERFVHDLVEARKTGEGFFPSFDHRAGDPVENDIQLSSSHSLVLVEGNYLLLNAAPWCRLRDEVFDETWYLDVPLQECNRRVMARHLKVGLSEEQARTRVMANDALNNELIARESPANAERIIRV